MKVAITAAFQHPSIHDRSATVPFDKSLSGVDIYTKPANGKTAGSYTTDGRWNLGGWSTYPSADELAISKPRPSSDKENIRK